MLKFDYDQLKYKTAYSKSAATGILSVDFNDRIITNSCQYSATRRNPNTVGLPKT